jgi:S1-C subfamily serine protease
VEKSALGTRIGLFGLFLFAAGVAASNPPRESGIQVLCEKVKPAYVFIGGGSGVVISAQGLMITNNHVVGAGKEFDVRLGNGHAYHARLLGRDVTGDLAVLQLDLKPQETTPFLELGDSEALHVGDATLAVGNPFAKGLIDQYPSFTLGVVSGIHQTAATYADAILTDAAVNPGNSGGPLIDMEGKVIGINGQISTRWGLRSNTGMGYAISVQQIRIWLPRLQSAKGGEVKHGRLLGLEFKRDDDLPLPAVVKSVAEGSHAEKSGLKAGDRIVRFADKDIGNIAQFYGLLGVYPEGQQVEVVVDRKGQRVPLKVVLLAAQPGKTGLKLLSPAKDDQYVKVAEVEKDSPAEKAGVKKEDEIVEIDHLRLAGQPQLAFAVLNRWIKNGVHAGEAVTLVVRRKEEPGKFVNHDLRLVPK